MTLVSLPSPILWPGVLGGISGGPSLGTTITMDAAGEYAAYAFVAREDMTVSHVSFRAGTVTTSGAAEVIVSIEGLDATTGLPDGAATFGGSASAATAVSSNSNPIIALGGSATITKGQTFCVKIAYSSGTSIIVQHLASIPPYISQSALPYQILNTGTPTKAITAVTTLIALGSSSTTFYQVPGTFPLSAYATGAFNNTNSAKRGMLFTPPMDCRIIGVRWFNGGATGDFNAIVFDNGGTPAELSSSSTAFDGNKNSENFTGVMTVYFDNTVTLAAGTAYRVVIEPSSATNVNVSTFTLPSADFFSASPAKSTAVYTSFATATWTDSTTQLPLMDILIDQVDDGTGSGGVIGVIGG